MKTPPIARLSPECFTSSSLTPPLFDEIPAAVELHDKKSAVVVLRDRKSTAVVPRIVEEIRKRKYGRKCSEEPWLTFRLDKGEYEDLEEQIGEDGYVQDKLRYGFLRVPPLHYIPMLRHRYDYFPSIEQFVLRMRTGTHEKFIASVVAEIVHQLNSIASRQGPSAAFAQKVRNCASTTITFDDPDYGRHDPDASFGHAKACFPGVVVEVSFSQKRKDLPRLADDYILGSNGSIRVVVGLDIEYSGNMGKLSVWRPQLRDVGTRHQELRTEQTVVDQVCSSTSFCSIYADNNQVFRVKDGKANTDPGAGLRLHLEDFATKELVDTFGNLADPVFIPAKDLSTYLDIIEEESEPTFKTPKPHFKRKLKNTPEEQLSSDREQMFEDDEDSVDKRSQKDDPSFKGSSTRSKQDDSSNRRRSTRRAGSS